MKRIINLLVLSFSAFQYAQAQSTEDINRVQSFITLGSGINSNVGLFGLQFEQRLSNPISVYGGAGLGTWGYKLSAGARYHLTGMTGSAFSLSYSRATGVKNLELKTDIERNGSTVSETISLNANPISLINISWLRYWKMGRKSRFNIELGYSFPLSSRTSNYTINTTNIVLAKTSADALSFIQPGGITIAFGFSFGIAEQVVLKD